MAQCERVLLKFPGKKKGYSRATVNVSGATQDFCKQGWGLVMSGGGVACREQFAAPG